MQTNPLEEVCHSINVLGSPGHPLAAGSLKLNGIMIHIVEDASLLGTCFGPRQVGNNFSKAIGDMYYRTNLLLARFHTCSSSTLSFLFRSYCTSFYGSPLWPLDDASLGRLSIAWRRSLKRVWRVSPLTHSVLIPLINNCAPLKIQLLIRFCTFIKSCMISTKPTHPDLPHLNRTKDRVFPYQAVI